MPNFLKKLRGTLLVGVGYMLSPLSWWNDIFFNLPIALVFGYGVAWFQPDWFFSGTILGYWLSNVIGMVMMQFGAIDVLLPDQKQNLKRDLWIGLGGSTLYTLVIAALIYWQVLEVPDFLANLHP